MSLYDISIFYMAENPETIIKHLKTSETDLSFLFKTTKHAIKQPRIQSDLNEEIQT